MVPPYTHVRSSAREILPCSRESSLGTGKEACTFVFFILLRRVFAQFWGPEERCQEDCKNNGYCRLAQGASRSTKSKHT